jgi:hypothetical protein
VSVTQQRTPATGTCYVFRKFVADTVIANLSRRMAPNGRFAMADGDGLGSPALPSAMMITSPASTGREVEKNGDRLVNEADLDPWSRPIAHVRTG